MMNLCSVAPRSATPLLSEISRWVSWFQLSDLYDPASLKALYEVFQTLAEDAPEVFGSMTPAVTIGRQLAPAAAPTRCSRRRLTSPVVAPLTWKMNARLNERRSPRIRERFHLQKHGGQACRSKVRCRGSSRLRHRRTRCRDRFEADRLADNARDLDPEQGLATIAVRLDTLAKRYQATAKGEADTNGADAEAAELRRVLEVDHSARMRFAAALAETEPRDFIQALLDAVELWTYAALTIRASARRSPIGFLSSSRSVSITSIWSNAAPNRARASKCWRGLWINAAGVTDSS